MQMRGVREWPAPIAQSDGNIAAFCGIITLEIDPHGQEAIIVHRSVSPAFFLIQQASIYQNVTPMVIHLAAHDG